MSNDTRVPDELLADLIRQMFDLYRFRAREFGWEWEDESDLADKFRNWASGGIELWGDDMDLNEISRSEDISVRIPRRAATIFRRCRRGEVSDSPVAQLGITMQLRIEGNLSELKTIYQALLTQGFNLSGCKIYGNVKLREDKGSTKLKVSPVSPDQITDELIKIHGDREFRLYGSIRF